MANKASRATQAAPLPEAPSPAVESDAAERPGDASPAVVASEPTAETPADSIQPSELTPLTPSDAPQTSKKQRKARRGRPPSGLSPEEAKARRNAKLREQRARKRALAAAESLAGIPAAPTPDQAAQPDADARVTGGGAAPTDAPELQATLEEKAAALAPMVGLGADLVARYAPPGWGGGTLKEEERELLGSVWALALAPYLGGASSPLMVAAVTTVQVFAIRAMEHRDALEKAAAKPPAEAPKASTPPVTHTAKTGAATAKKSERDKAQTGKPLRVQRLPTYSEDE